eukprot:8393124-Pyramimonas_sp.AAC.1
MGIRGAAYATVFSQYLCLAMMLTAYFRRAYSRHTCTIHVTAILVTAILLPAYLRRAYSSCRGLHQCICLRPLYRPVPDLL